MRMGMKGDRWRIVVVGSALEESEGACSAFEDDEAEGSKDVLVL